MLTPGNLKLGGRRIWGFALPSGTPDVTPPPPAPDTEAGSGEGASPA